MAQFASGFLIGITTFFENVGNAIGQIINFFRSLWNLVTITIQFIPQPFLAITLIMLPVLIASISLKAVRG